MLNVRRGMYTNHWTCWVKYVTPKALSYLLLSHYHMANTLSFFLPSLETWHMRKQTSLFICFTSKRYVDILCVSWSEKILHLFTVA
jgi:hypothetical protein